MDLISEIVARAKANKQRIVLPEGTEERTLKAANQILTDGVADLILLGNPDEILGLAQEWGLGNISKATIIDPENHPKKEEYAQLLCELRKKKGMTIEEARKLVLDPLYLGCLIIKNGDADVSWPAPATRRVMCSAPPCRLSRQCPASLASAAPCCC
jgi:phosphate acetyltransferase